MSRKVAMITGASKGLGEFLARRFWEAGFDLCLVGRNESALNLVSRSLPEKTNQKTLSYSCDFSLPLSVNKLNNPRL